MVDRSVGIIVLPAVIPSSSINFCTNVVIMFLSLVQCYKCRGLVSFITFFTPIPCSYTSLLLVGVARTSFSSCISKIKQFIAAGSIYFSYLLCSRGKTIWFSIAGIEPRSSLLASDRSNHRPCRPASLTTLNYQMNVQFQFLLWVKKVLETKLIANIFLPLLLKLGSWLGQRHGACKSRSK